MLEEKLPPTTYNLSEGFDFILAHFQEPIFPRTISTWKLENRQVEIFGKENAINLFGYSKFIDCKINAYPSHTEYKGINRQAPNFIFIDLDKSSFKSERSLKIALKHTLKNIKEKLNGAYPTVLWSGNGYHIYLPAVAKWRSIGIPSTVSHPLNKLYQEFLRLVLEVSPKFFVIENVERMLQIKDGKVRTTIESILNGKYSISFYVKDTANFGVPQRRKRVLIIGNRLGCSNPGLEETHSDTISEKKPYVTVSEAISDLPRMKHDRMSFLS